MFLEENLHREESPRIIDLSKAAQILANEFNGTSETILNGSLPIFKNLTQEQKEKVINQESINISVVIEKVLNSGYDCYRVREADKPRQGQLFLATGKLTNYCG